MSAGDIEQPNNFSLLHPRHIDTGLQPLQQTLSIGERFTEHSVEHRNEKPKVPAFGRGFLSR
jgi:hypothetical protein